MVLVVLAYTTANGAALRECVAYAEANHSILAGRAFRQFAEPLAHYAESVAIVEVVAVEHSERLVDYACAHHQRVVCTPRLCATLRTCEALRQRVEALENKLARDMTFVFRENDATEVFFEILADNEHELAEASVDSVVDTVIHDCLTVRTELIELLQTTVAAAHTCSEEEKCWFHNYYILFKLNIC